MYTSGMNRYVIVEVAEDESKDPSLTPEMKQSLGLFSADQIAVVQAFLLYQELLLEWRLSRALITEITATGAITNRSNRNVLKAVRRDFAKYCEANRQIKAMEELS